MTQSASDDADAIRGRILLLCQHFYPEMISTGMHMTELSSALAAMGWSVQVYCAQPSLDLSGERNRVPVEMEHNGVRIRRVPAFGSHRQGLIWRAFYAVSYSFFSAIAALWRRRRYDVIVLTTNPPLLAAIMRVVAFLVRRPYVQIVYDIYPETAASLGEISRTGLVFRVWQWLSRMVLVGAKVNVVIGRDMQAVVSDKCGPGRCRTQLIPNWSDEQVVAPVRNRRNRFREKHANPGTVIVQYSGRMGRIHNVEALLDAAELLRNSDVLFQFIGDGAKRQVLQKRAQQQDLKNVQFLDYQPLSELSETLSAADIAAVCLSSASTGLSVPSKAYGIMAAGRPILALLDRSSEIGRAVEEHQCGFVVEAADGRKVADAIISVLSDPEQLERMGQNARAAFQANYTLTTAARKYDALLRDVLLSRRPVTSA